MGLRYNKLGSEYLIKPYKTHTLNGSAQNLHVVSGTFECALLVIDDADLTGALTVRARGNTAADGSGTDYTLTDGTFALASGTNQSLKVEIDSSQMSHEADRQGVEFKSLVFEVTGTNTDTMAACVVVRGYHQFADQTPTDDVTPA